jgi:outer membrane receptor protein involved in Fe transport
MTVKILPIPHRRALLLAALATTSMLAVTAAQAQTSHTIHITAGSLDTALLALAAQSHDQLLYAPGLVSGRKAAPLDGAFTTETALHRLLAGTDIVVQKTGASSFALRRAPAADAPIAATPAAARSQEAGPFADRPIATLKTAPAELALQTNTVAEVEVTGTHLRGVTDSASPVEVISRADFERSGYLTVAEALQAMPQNFGGPGTETTVAQGLDKSSANSFYASGVNLRGLGPNATLTLVNGHRLAGTGLNADFADLSTLPSAAVERVEVLLDGASALYGSDAVGGVVNVILRRNFDGAETRISDGVATRGGPAQFQISQVIGRTWTGGSVTLALEHDQRGDLLARDRPFSSTANLVPQGGTDHRLIFAYPGNIVGVNPATGISGPFWAIPAGQNGVGLTPGSFVAGTENLQEPLAQSALLPKQAADSFYGSVNQRLASWLDLSADVTFGRRGFQLPTGTISSAFPVSRNNPFFVSPVGATSETIDYAFGDLPSPRLKGSTTTFTTTVGADATLPRDWHLSAYGTFAEDHSRTAQTGLLNSTTLNEALGNTPDNPATTYNPAVNGFYNPFAGQPGSNSPTVLSFIGSGYSTSDTRDRVTSGDLKLDGTLFNLPAGAIRIAMGGDVRREEYERSTVGFTSGGAPSKGTPQAFSRDVTAAYAEFRAPLLASDSPIGALDLSAAGRVEHYSDFGDTRNPKVGLIWTPSSDLHVRASWGTSFRAPSLPQLFGGQAFTANHLAMGSAGSVLVVLLQGSNPTLSPETATSWSFGFDYAPSRVPGFRVSASWFDTDFTNRIDQPVRSVLGTALTDPAYASFVNFVSPATKPADLSRVQALIAAPESLGLSAFPANTYSAIVDARYVNTGSLHVSGLDAQASYATDVGQNHLQFATNLTYLDRYDIGVTPTSVAIRDVNVANFPVRLRGRATAAATRGLFTGQVAFNYVNAYNAPLGQGVDSQVTTDLQLRAQAPEHGHLAGFSASLSVRNLFDRKPPFYDSPNGVAYDPANADAIGRFVSLQISKTW